MPEIDRLLAVRIVTPTREQFARTRDFYRALLGSTESGRFGDESSVHEAAFFRVGALELIVTREQGATPEAKIEQGPVWLCFESADPKAAHAAARSRGAPVPRAPVSTSFGTEGFFANDPMGLPVYVGTPWRSPQV